MSDLSFTLGQWSLPTVRLTCEKCGDATDLDKDMLIALYGEDFDMFMLRVDLAETYCEQSDVLLGCKTVLADYFLHQAITQPDISKVARPELLPEARTWRARLGLDITEFDSQTEDAA